MARLNRAGAYVVWCTVGGQAVVGWPRVVQVVPGRVDGDTATWRAEADTAALTSELVARSGNAFGEDGRYQAGGDGRYGVTTTARRLQSKKGLDTVVSLRKESDGLKQRLAKYEQAAAIVMEAAEASGVDLKRAARDAAFRAEADKGGSGSQSRHTRSLREGGHDQRL